MGDLSQDSAQSSSCEHLPPAADPTDLVLARLRNAILDAGILRSPHHRLLGRDGRELQWLVDLRPLLLDPTFLRDVATAFWDHFAHLAPCQVGGLEMAAIPIVTAILLEAQARHIDASGFIVRRERKAYGRGQLIEGIPQPDLPIILVDDIFNSGRSLDLARAALADSSLRPTSVFVVIDFESPRCAAWLQQHAFSLVPLLHLGDLGINRTSHRPSPPQQRYAPLWSFVSQGGNPFHKVPKSTPLLVGDRLYLGADTGPSPGLFNALECGAG